MNKIIFIFSALNQKTMKKILLIFGFTIFVNILYSQCTTTNATSCVCADGSLNCLLLPDITASWKGISNGGWTEYPQSGAGTNYNGQGPDDGRLRVTGSTPNIGHGSFTVRGQDATGKRAFICGNDTIYNVSATGAFTCPNGNPNPKQMLVQRVYKKDGNTMTYVDTWRGSMTYHSAHGHNHVDDWAVMTLRIATSDPNPLNWPIVGEGAKIGFCLMDYGQCGTSTASTYYGHCRDENTVYNQGNIMLNTNFPNWNLGGGAYNCSVVEQGISSGWTDVYGKHLDGMWINVPANTCNGDYYIVMEVDKNNYFQEEREDNNYTAVPVTLTMQQPVNSGALPKITSTSSNNLCSGSSMTLTATAGTSFLWNTGETTQSITVSQPGTYFCTVTNYCGTGTSEPFTVNNVTPNAPVVNDLTICGGETATLTASATGNVRWFDDQGNLVNSGLSFTTPALSQNTTYFVENTDSYNDTLFAEPHTNGIGGGGYVNSAQYNIFNAHEPLTIKSALVYAQSAGNLTIKLQNDQGQDLQSTTVTVPAGMSRVNLNFPVVADSNLRLGVTAMTVTGLYRNNNSATFPYNLNNSLSIIGASAGASYYYYLYDWEILTQNGQCSSTQVPVTISVQNVVQPTSSDVTICEGETAILNANGGSNLTWYNSSNQQVGTGATYTTSNLTSNSTFSVVNTENGCESNPVSVNVLVEPCAMIPELQQFIESFSISPNPSSGEFSVDFISYGFDEVEISIVDLNGKKIFSESKLVSFGTNKIPISISQIASGVYSMEVNYLGYSFIRKIIKN
jgi:hypothetical protein